MRFSDRTGNELYETGQNCPNEISDQQTDRNRLPLFRMGKFEWLIRELREVYQQDYY